MGLTDYQVICLGTSSSHLELKTKHLRFAAKYI